MRRLLLVAPAVALLAACGAQPVQVADPAPDEVAYPVVAAGQARSVLDAVDSALNTAVPTKAGVPVDARIVGPYRDLAVADAKVAAQRKRKATVPALIDRQQLIVPSSTGWPRFFVAVGSSAAASTPVLRVLTSESARSPYGLWAEPVLLPGVTLPVVGSATAGAPAVSVDASGLVLSPKEVLSSFASYLNDGAKTTASRPFDRSDYSDQLLSRLAADKKTAKKVGGTVTSTHSVVSDQLPLSVRTADGGALVIGALNQKYVLTVKAGQGRININDKDLQALAGGKTSFSKSITRNALEVVVFYVPPKGKGEITVVAAQKGDIAATTK